jgi:hypothetical protein
MRLVAQMAVAALLLAACGGDDTTPTGSDASIDAPEGPDAGPDAEPADADVPDAPPMADAGVDQPVGAPCSTNGECAGGFCLNELMFGWPAGYCSNAACDLADPDNSCLPFGGDGICLDVGTAMMPQGLCFDLCDPALGDADCRALYMCTPLGDGRGVCVPRPVCGDGMVDPPEECEPPGTATCDDMCQGTGAAAIGAMCTTAADCSGDFCIDAWPGGYCSDLACDLGDPDNSCLPYGGDGLCVDVGDGMGGPYGACLDQCDPAMSGADCRAGYMCQDIGTGQGVCTPMPVCGDGTVTFPEECEPPGTPTCDSMCVGTGTAAVGEMCMGAGDCLGNYCLTDADGFMGGYCTFVGCDLADPSNSCLMYGGDGLCIDSGDGVTGICVDTCAPGPGACRMGYTCTMLGGGARACLP